MQNFNLTVTAKTQRPLKEKTGDGSAKKKNKTERIRKKEEQKSQGMCASSRKLMIYSTYVPLKSIYLACCTPLSLPLLLLLCSLSPLFYTVADSTGTLVWNLFGIGMRVFKMQHMPLGVAQTADGGGGK